MADVHRSLRDLGRGTTRTTVRSRELLEVGANSSESASRRTGEGTAVNVTAWSYVDRLCVGTLTCPDLVPDPHGLAEGPHAALAELVAAAGRSAPRSARAAL